MVVNLSSVQLCSFMSKKTRESDRQNGNQRPKEKSVKPSLHTLYSANRVSHFSLASLFQASHNSQSRFLPLQRKDEIAAPARRCASLQTRGGVISRHRATTEALTLHIGYMVIGCMVKSYLVNSVMAHRRAGSCINKIDGTCGLLLIWSTLEDHISDLQCTISFSGE